MKKISSNKQKPDVQMHIEKGWDLIDNYLPVTYVEKVIESNPNLKGFETKIRNVRRKLQKAEHQIEIFIALVDVAKKSKEALESISEI